MNSPAAWSERAMLATSWDAALWSEEGQTERFQAVLRHLDLQVGDELLDFGCGTGRFHDFLPLGIVYHGYDWADGMRERALAEHSRVRILATLPDMMFDHIVVIGVFNLADNWTKDDTWRQLLELWHEYTRTTLVCSLYRGNDPECLSYGVDELADFAKMAGCHRFSIDATYRDNDVLLEMRR